MIFYNNSVGHRLSLLCVLAAIFIYQNTVSALPRLLDDASLPVTTSDAEAFASAAKGANVTWLTWTNSSSIESFTDLEQLEGRNYRNCGKGRVLVGIQCSNKNCNTLTLTCATLTAISGAGINIDMSKIPTLGDVREISSYGDFFSSNSNVNYRACRPGEIANGMACLGTDCNLQSFYCGSILQPKSSEQVLFMAPFSVMALNATSRLQNDYCSFENTATTNGPAAICPTNKVVAGALATGKKSSALQVLCCPVYQMNPVDCQYTDWTPVGSCIPAVNNCGGGVQLMGRNITAQPQFLGKSCASSLQSMRPCYIPCANGGTSADPDTEAATGTSVNAQSTQNTTEDSNTDPFAK